MSITLLPGKLGELRLSAIGLNSDRALFEPGENLLGDFIGLLPLEMRNGSIWGKLHISS